MLKPEVKKIVKDRATTHYPKSVITVLDKIIELTHVPDWQKDHVENFSSTPKTKSKLAFLTNLRWRTVSRALTILLQDGVIQPNPRAKYSYILNAETLRSFTSRYLSEQSQDLERKIIKAVRMKFTRNPNRQVQPWPEVHPEVFACACDKTFCSHPSTI